MDAVERKHWDWEKERTRPESAREINGYTELRYSNITHLQLRVAREIAVGTLP